MVTMREINLCLLHTEDHPVTGFKTNNNIRIAKTEAIYIFTSRKTFPRRSYILELTPTKSKMVRRTSVTVLIRITTSWAGDIGTTHFNKVL